MTQPWLRAPELDFARVRDELGLTAEFGPEALAEAGAAADRHADRRTDRRDLELVTIDPPTSLDLDQALRVRRDDDGYLVHYAIADVAALVTPGGALDAETRRRGATIYFPDGNVPLHPRVLSENAGSLLPEVDRAAVLWTVRVAGDGEVLETSVERATVRSRARFDYAQVAADAAADRLHPSITGLPGFGAAREEWGLGRGAVALELPDQEVVRNEDPGRRRAWTLRLAPSTPADRWNAQVSLLVGMCAGTLMRAGGIGFYRTLPAASDEAVGELRAVADRLGVPWPEGASPGRFLAGLDPAAPSTLALMSAGASLMRGAGYRAVFSGDDVPDAELVHAGVGGLYAHVTAPLRRLADRYATEIALALSAGTTPEPWVLDALPGLGKIMSGAGSTASSAARRSVDLAEATVLADQIGARFPATVMRAANERRPAQVFIASPAIIAPCDDAPDAGSECTAEVAVADPEAGTVGFTAV
ncbi:MAG: RNB domain-containing ribonuclease [Gordonia sp. (in: high G+C Gram-positive bacteria)]|uniref:RNB domain-containing ribonuclease n=1 Tax=Gordonia sp. (in: high G+C Gram-positive bacteria) TaxID=84139 RepID=UPI0039E308AE